jgi:hypothetical protein
MRKTLTVNIDPLLNKLTPSNRGRAAGYLIASGLVLVALIARLSLAPAEAGVPFLTFFPVQC